MKKRRKSSAGIFERCAAEVMGMMSLIEIYSDYEMIISGCKGIVDYSDRVVIADTVSGRVCVNGCCLSLDVFRGDMLSISGRIQSICFGG